jgi:hypothetical protein
MKTRAALLSAAVALTLASAAGARPLSDAPRVRPLNPQAAAMVAEAQQKSPTVRDLVKALQGGDVVVYVQVVRAVEGAPLSTVQFVGASQFERYVLVQVASCQEPCRSLELLGHELRHAADLAAARWITDDYQLQRLLAYTGWRDHATARGYETASAMKTERQVGREIRALMGAMH